MGYSSIRTIHDVGTGADRFSVASYGNGAAYAFQFGDMTSSMRTLWFDGDDATQIRDDFDRLETARPDMLTHDVWLEILDPYL